jgi:N6-adenosine-specific RNA methylase IME4
MIFDGLPLNHFRVVYADPPWQFKTYNEKGRKKLPDWKPFKGASAQHYETMKLDDIINIPVRDIAAKDAALFMWVVQPMLPEAMQVLDAWGFEFKTVVFCWVKMLKSWVDTPSQMEFFPVPIRVRPRLGLGYHTRSGMEQCWLAVRGKGYRRQKRGVEQVLHAPLSDHSKKPEEFARRIELLTGDVPRIELFARRYRKGWTVWGDEVDARKSQFPLMGPDELVREKIKSENRVDWNAGPLFSMW